MSTWTDQQWNARYDQLKALAAESDPVWLTVDNSLDIALQEDVYRFWVRVHGRVGFIVRPDRKVASIEIVLPDWAGRPDAKALATLRYNVSGLVLHAVPLACVEGVIEKLYDIVARPASAA